MLNLFKVVGLVFLTVIGLIITTLWRDGESLRSALVVLDYPVVAIGDHPRGWIAAAQVDARGVIALGQVAGGLITFAQGGVGVIAGLGQGMMGLLVAGQLAIGMFGALGQLALGRQSIGQAAWVKRDYFSELHAELTPLFSKRPFPGPPLPPPIRRRREPDPSRVPRRAWPDAIQGRLAGRSVCPGMVTDRANALNIDVATLTVSPVDGSDPIVIRDPGDAVLQLSYSEQPRAFGWLLGLLGQPKVTTWLHVEVRRSRGSLMTLSAPVPAALVEDIPRLPKRGAVVTEATLLDLLGAAAAIQLDVIVDRAQGSETLEAVEVPSLIKLFNALQYLLRPGAMALYVFPWLLIPKLVLRIAGSPLEGWVTVAYCALVVYVFSTFALVMMLYPSVGPPSERFDNIPVAEPALP